MPNYHKGCENKYIVQQPSFISTSKSYNDQNLYDSHLTDVSDMNPDDELEIKVLVFKEYL
jgi:hypothetical protein